MDFPSFITKVQPELLLDSAGVTGKAQEFKKVDVSLQNCSIKFCEEFEYYTSLTKFEAK